jgi:hypothetical protein
MKNILTLVIVLITNCICAQESMGLSQDTVVYLTSEQEAFMIDKETKFLFKTSPLQFERKLSEAFSINLSIAPELLYGRKVTEDSNELFLSSIYLQSEAELRYYYKLPRLIKEGKQANNLSSTYVGLGGRYGETIYTSDKPISTSSRSSYSIYGAWGDQKRFLNYGYLDYGLELSYVRTKIDQNIISEEGIYSFVNLSTRTKVGFAFGKTYDIKEEVKCPIFKCYLDRKSAFKFNYNSLFGISIGKNNFISDKNQLTIRLNPNIAYEHKIGSSSFSVNQDLELYTLLSNTKGEQRDDFGISVYSLNYSVGVRYYESMKTNIKKGKSGNNLSGWYGFLRGSYEIFGSESTFTGIDGEPIISKYRNETIRAEFGAGYQKTVLNDLYFDLQFGLRPILKSYGNPVNASTEAIFIVDFKVGKMF